MAIHHFLQERVCDVQPVTEQGDGYKRTGGRDTSKSDRRGSGMASHTSSC